MSKVEISAREVISYLREHPDFFQKHEHLLEELVIPHQSGSAVSLVERQMSMLREQKQELQRQMQHIAQTAKGNENLLERMQSLLLELIESTSLSHTLSKLYTSLREDFHADVVTLRLIDGPENLTETVPADEPGLAHFKEMLQKHKPVCGYLSPEQRNYLFAERATEVASGVVVPLCEPGRGRCLGLLAIGSVDPRRYHAEMGTVFVNHLGVMLTRLLAQRLGK